MPERDSPRNAESARSAVTTQDRRDAWGAIGSLPGMLDTFADMAGVPGVDLPNPNDGLEVGVRISDEQTPEDKALTSPEVVAAAQEFESHIHVALAALAAASAAKRKFYLVVKDAIRREGEQDAAIKPGGSTSIDQK